MLVLLNTTHLFPITHIQTVSSPSTTTPLRDLYRPVTIDVSNADYLIFASVQCALRKTVDSDHPNISTGKLLMYFISHYKS